MVATRSSRKQAEYAASETQNDVTKRTDTNTSSKGATQPAAKAQTAVPIVHRMSPGDDDDYEPPEVLAAREATKQLKAKRAQAPHETRKPRMDLFAQHLDSKLAAAKASPAGTNRGRDSVMRKPPCFWEADGESSGEAQVASDLAVASEVTRARQIRGEAEGE
eukprot:1130862-Prymnesium_polylepis.2